MRDALLTVPTLDPRLQSQRAMAEAALARAPYDPHAHDAYARVLVACDLLDLAADAWETARTLHPGHVGAIKGLGFLAFRRGDLLAAERLLSDALSRAPGDAGTKAALARVRAAAGTAEETAPARQEDSVTTAAPIHPQAVGRPNDAAPVALLTNTDGLVLAGTLGGDGASAQRATVACEMSGLARALDLATQHLALGRWNTCLVESATSALAVSAPMPQMLLLTVAAGEGAAGRVLAVVPAEAAVVRLRMGGAL